MCLICVEFNAKRMNTTEARKAFKEMWSSLELEHVKEVEKLIYKQELKEFREHFYKSMAEAKDVIYVPLIANDKVPKDEIRVMQDGVEKARIVNVGTDKDE